MEPDLVDLYLYCMEEDDASKQWIYVISRGGNTTLG